MTRPIVHLAQFAEPTLCRHLIDCWEQHRGLTTRESGEASFFDQRVLHVVQILECAPKIGRQLVALGRRMAHELQISYSTPEILPDDVQLVKWWQGHEMRPHADSEHPGGATHPTPWREFSGVVYLNDDYDGGELCFPSFGKTFKPRAGDFVGFGGGLDFLHGVARVEAGVRYTCPAWFTSDSTQWCPAFRRKRRKYVWF